MSPPQGERRPRQESAPAPSHSRSLLPQLRDSTPPALPEDTGRGEPVGDGAIVVDLDTVTPRRVRWLWPGRIPDGKLTVIEGDPGSGKTLIVGADLAARISTGAPMPDGVPGQQGTVIVASAEDDPEDTIVPRLIAAGADLRRVKLLDGVRIDGEDKPAVFPRDVYALERMIVECGAVMVVIDPLMAFLPSRRDTDSHSDQDARTVLRPLRDVASRTGCAIVVIRHLNKGQGSRAIYRGGGSIGIIAQARAGFVVADETDDDGAPTGRQVLACVKMNLAPKPATLAYRIVTDAHGWAPRIEWGGAVELDADALVGATGRRPGRPRKVGDARDLLRDVLGDGQWHDRADVKVAADDARIGWRTVEDAKRELDVEARQERGDGGRMRPAQWRLPRSADTGPQKSKDYPFCGPGADGENGAATGFSDFGTDRSARTLDGSADLSLWDDSIDDGDALRALLDAFPGAEVAS